MYYFEIFFLMEVAVKVLKLDCPIGIAGHCETLGGIHTTDICGDNLYSVTSSTSPFSSTLNLFVPLTLYFPVLHKRLSHSYQHVGDMEEEQDG